MSDKTDLTNTEQSLHHSKGKSAQAGDGMWGGRFNESTDEFVQAFTASVTFDQRMYRQDIRGSRAHATMLERTGVISKSDHDAIQLGLNEVEDQINSGTFDWSVALEDVHMNIESALTARIGDAGKRLHTGRSRNDQVATDIRLYLRDACDELAVQLLRLLNGLLPLAEAHKATIMPGFTHLQTAQPVTFGHHVMALWMSAQFRFIDLPDRFCTGSSIMPQKKNPDVPELVRGKTGRVYGNLMSLLTLMKSQPLAYNKDNQEDKEPLFDSVDTWHGCLCAFADMLPAIQVREQSMRAADRLMHEVMSVVQHLMLLLLRRTGPANG